MELGGLFIVGVCVLPGNFNLHLVRLFCGGLVQSCCSAQEAASKSKVCTANPQHVQFVVPLVVHHDKSK